MAARAKMLQAANLGWLEGFPVEAAEDGVRWITVPVQAPAEEVTLDGRHLSRATYALNKLRTELAPALPRLADEPDRWMESIERRLELLKGAIHHGGPLPPRAFEDLFEPRSLRDRAARMAEAEPRLRPLLDALAWVQAGDPRRGRAMLEAAVGWAGGFELLTERLGRDQALVTALRLLQLAAEHGREPVEPPPSCWRGCAGRRSRRRRPGRSRWPGPSRSSLPRPAIPAGRPAGRSSSCTGALWPASPSLPFPRCSRASSVT